MQSSESFRPVNTPPAAGPRQTDWLSIGQLTLGGLGLGLSLLSAALLGIFGLSMVFGETGLNVEATTILGMSWVSLFVAALTIPSIIFSLRRLLSRPVEVQAGSEVQTAGEARSSKNLRKATLVLLLWPLLVLVGMQVSEQTSLSWLVLPPLQLLIIALPTWWLVEALRYKLPVTSRRRDWGLVNFSVFITTPALMLVEIIVFALLLVVFVLWISSQPDLIAEIERIAGQIMLGPADPQAILDIVAPYLANPWVILGTLGMAAILVPLIEELIKPLGVLLLAGRNPTPAEGFIAGALSGATFGLVESLLYMTNPAGDGWAVLAVGRTGTLLLHTATTALVGWAMAEAFRGRGFMRFLGAYLLAVALHGLWNGLAVLAGFGAIIETAPDSLVFLESLTRISPFLIVFLGVILFGVLLWGNRRLRQQAAATTGS